MRIAFVADPRHPNTDRWVSYLASEFGHDVVVVATTAPPYPERTPYRIVPCPVRARFGYLLAGPRVRQILRAVRPDLLVGYRIQSNGLAAALSGFRPLVLAGQTETIVWPPHHPVYRLCVKWALGRADLLQAWGSHMADRLLELGVRSEKILTLPRGVDTSVFRPASKPTVAPVLIMTRALRPIYNHAALLRALAEPPLEAARLLIAGEGGERVALEGLAGSLGVASRVHFAGRRGASDLAEDLRSSRAYVTLVTTEGISSSLLEAMACGVLPVVPDLPANREWIVDGRNGALLPPEVIDAPPRLAARLASLLADDALVERAFALNPPVIAERADWKTNLSIMNARYRSLTGKH